MGVPGEDYGSDRWSLDHLFVDQDGGGRDVVLLAVKQWYDFPEFGGYLGNFG